MDKVKVAIVGMGTVGTGVARLLLDFGERTAQHAGRKLCLTQVVVQDARKARGLELPAKILSDDLRRVTDDAEISAVALLIGGLEPARSIMRSHTDVAIRMFDCLAKAGINVEMINTSEVRVNVVVSGPRGREGLAALQTAFADATR